MSDRALRRFEVLRDFYQQRLTIAAADQCLGDDRGLDRALTEAATEMRDHIAVVLADPPCLAAAE